ncbi:MAG: hypothetical protein COB53_10775 [Elusimicrobia bacterium]|nr:MAG: hypothetical protein COB53_10775 [Elusimicrobiota bacterium]
MSAGDKKKKPVKKKHDVGTLIEDIGVSDEDGPAERHGENEEGYCEGNWKTMVSILGVMIVFVVGWTLIYRNEQKKNITIHDGAANLGGGGGVHAAMRAGMAAALSHGTVARRRANPAMNNMPAMNTMPAANRMAALPGTPEPPPLPADARFTIVPPHGDIGRCHNCHPVGTGTGAGTPQGGQPMLQQPMGQQMMGQQMMGQQMMGGQQMMMGQQVAIPGLPKLPPCAVDFNNTCTRVPHPDRGACHNCHGMKAGPQPIMAQAVAIPGLPAVPSCAVDFGNTCTRPPHGDRGPCHNCHPMSSPAMAGGGGMTAVSPVAFVPDLMPLPGDARAQVTPPHGERGPCHSCHPFSSRAVPAIDMMRAVVLRRVGMSVAEGFDGVFVGVVGQGSHAKRAGLQHGDVIATFDHRAVTDVPQLFKLVRAAREEKRVPVKVLRNGKAVRMNVMIGEGEMGGVMMTPLAAGMPVNRDLRRTPRGRNANENRRRGRNANRDIRRGRNANENRRRGRNANEDLRRGNNAIVGAPVAMNGGMAAMNGGMAAAPLMGVEIPQMGIFVLDRPSGLAVVGVEANSTAARAGMKSGDFITGFNHRRITSADKLARLAAGTRKEKRVQVRIRRAGTMRRITVRMQEVQRVRARDPRAALPIARGMPAAGEFRPQQAGFVACPLCGIRMHNPQGVDARKLSCPRCGVAMTTDQPL